ncbi:site-2 protease family protein [bacterium]|nr:site-2 protease family protein [bacterium]
MTSTLEAYAYLIIALVIVISIHEASHAFVAYKLGDPTAKNRGRLTLNPKAHLDVLGTLMLFIAGFGWGKPVPVNPYNFKNPIKDSALVSLAGPASNLLTALICSIPLKYVSLPVSIATLLWTITDLSILLAIFNLLPFPPLDGSKIFAVFVPHKYQPAYFRFMEKSQIYFLVFILLDIVVVRRYLGFSILWLVLGNLFDFVKALIFLGG